MKKRMMGLCLLLLSIALLCGCTESEIACGVTADNTAFLRFDLELDLRELNVREQIPILTWIKDRAAELKEKGFTVEHNAITVSNELTWLRAELRRSGESREQAVELLRQMLCDESLSPFTEASAELESQALQDAFRLQVRAEPGELLATAGIESFPKRLRERMQGWLAGSSLRLSLSLPATELPAGEEAELRDGVAVKTAVLPLTENGDVSLSTICYLGGGENGELWWGGSPRSAESAGALAAAMGRDEAKLRRLSAILIPAAGALAALALLFFLWGTVRAGARRRAAEAAARAAFQAEAQADPPFGTAPAPEGTEAAETEGRDG